jgi:hypothetical protein
MKKAVNPKKILDLKGANKKVKFLMMKKKQNKKKMRKKRKLNKQRFPNKKRF